MPVNPWENRASSELLYKTNRLQVSMVYRLINHLGCWSNTLKEFNVKSKQCDNKVENPVLAIVFVDPVRSDLVDKYWWHGFTRIQVFK